MDGQGDGSHNGRNRPNIPLPHFPGGNFPPADQLHAGLIAWLHFLLHHAAFDGDAPFMLEGWIEEPENGQIAGNDENDGDDESDESDDDDDDDDENHDDAVNENHGNDENLGNADSNDNNIGNNNADNENVNENVEDVGAHDEVGVDQGVEDDCLPGPSRRGPREQELEDIRGRSGQQFRLWDDNSDSYSADPGVVEENPPLPGPSRRRSREEDGLDVEKRSQKRLRFSDVSDCITVRDTDCDEDAGTNAEVTADDPLPGSSRESSRDEAGQIYGERSFKNVRWWDEFDFTSDSDTDSYDAHFDINNTDKNIRNSPVEHASVEFVEEDPLPGPSKRSREEDGQDVEQRSRKRVRLCEDSDCTSDRDSDKTDCDNITNKNIENSPAEPAGPSAKVAEENPLPGRKRTRKSKRAEDETSSSEKSSEIKSVAGSSSETARTRSDHDHTCSRSNPDLAEDAGAVEETEEKATKQVEGEDQQPGVSRKRSREDEEGEDKNCKRFKL